MKLFIDKSKQGAKLIKKWLVKTLQKKKVLTKEP